MLCYTPDLARHVQELVIHPDYIGENETAGYELAGHWCSAISNLVAQCARYMDALRSFVWNASSALPKERMWSELRRWCVSSLVVPRPLPLTVGGDSCPNLKTLGTSFVHQLPSPKSEVCPTRPRRAHALTAPYTSCSHLTISPVSHCTLGKLPTSPAMTSPKWVSTSFLVVPYNR